MKIYEVKVVAQVFYITSVWADSGKEAKESAFQMLDDIIGDDVEIHLNWTDILSEKEEKDA